MTTTRTIPREAFDLISRLTHEVGKYISRTAVNIVSSTVPPALCDLLIVDLYALKDGERASAVFERYASPIEAMLGALDPLLACRTKLGRIDVLEIEVREGNASAIAEAAALAREVSKDLFAMRDGFATKLVAAPR